MDRMEQVNAREHPVHPVYPGSRRVALLRDAAVLSILLLPVLIFYADPLFTGRVFYFRDFSRFFQPNWQYAAERLRAGELPLWDPYCMAGHPFFAAWYAGVLYPLSVIYILFPFNAGLTFFIVLHAYLALATMYLLTRDLGCGRPAAMASALTFGLSGFVLSVVDNPNMLTGLVWMPLALLFVRRAMSGRRASGVGRRASGVGRQASGVGRWTLANLIAAAAVLAVQVLAGGPEAVYCTWLLVGLWGVARLIDDRMHGVPGRVIGRRLAVLAGCLVLGAGLSAVQLVPFAELLDQSARGGSGYEMGRSAQWSVPLRDLLRFLVPDFMTNETPIGVRMSGQQWLKSFYLGLAPLVLAAVALWRVRGRRVLFFAGAAVLGTLLACGPDTLFWVAAYLGLPGIAGTRFPAKFMLLPTFALSVLAGLGAQWLLAAPDAARRRTLRALVLAALIALVGVSIGLGVLRANIAFRTDAAGAVLEDTYRPRVESWRITQQSLIRTGVVLGALALLLAALARRGMRNAECGMWDRRGTIGIRHAAFSILNSACLACLGILLVADTLLYHRPQLFTADARIYRLRAASMDLFGRQAAPARVFYDPLVVRWTDTAYRDAKGHSDPLLFLRELHSHNLPLVSKVQSCYGFVPVAPARYERLFTRLRERPAPYRLPLVDFLNARVVIYAPLMKGEPSLDAIRFEANADALPRATIVHAVLHAPPAAPDTGSEGRGPRTRAFADRHSRPRTPDDLTLDWLTSEAFDPRRAVLIEDGKDAVSRQPSAFGRPTSRPGSAAELGRSSDFGVGRSASDVGSSAPPDRVDFLTYEPERVVMHVVAAAPGYLVLADQFYPGWHATVTQPSAVSRQSSAAPILRANYCFRAVPVPAGTSVVELTYRPVSLTLGLVMTAVSVLATLGLLLVLRIRRRRVE